MKRCIPIIVTGLAMACLFLSARMRDEQRASADSPAAARKVYGEWLIRVRPDKGSEYSELIARKGLPLFREAGGGSLVTLDFDNRQAWPSYDWMGVAKAALQSVTRYLARDLGAEGIRVNAVSAGPLGTIAAKSIPGFEIFNAAWAGRAPLGWDATDPEPVARMACVLFSDWAPATSGEVVHVDGGFHALALGVRGDTSEGLEP